MEREQWHIFHLKVVSLITIVTFLIVTGFLAVTFGQYYAIYETQYAVKLEIHEIQRSYMSQYIYICYLGCLYACDLIACLAILYNLNYIILFSVFHHLTMLLVKIFSGFQLPIPGDHTLAVLGLFVLLHTVIILTLSLLYRKLDSITERRELLNGELRMKEQESKRLKDRDQLNDRLLSEYQQKYLTSPSKRSSHETARRDSSRTVELEPVDIEQDFDTIKRNLKGSQPTRGSGGGMQQQSFDSHGSANQRNVSYASHNDRNINSFNSHRNAGQRTLQEHDYDSDGYLQANTMPGSRRANELGASSQLIPPVQRALNERDEDSIVDHLNKQNVITKYCRSYSVGDESTDLYFEPDCADDYVENDYDYLKCSIDKAYADEYLNGNRPANLHLVKPGILKKSDRSPSDRSTGKSTDKQQQPLPSPNRQLIDKSVQTNQSNSSNEAFHTATDQDLCEAAAISANASGVKESYHQQSGQTKSRKVEYSTLKYDHRILYETSV